MIDIGPEAGAVFTDPPSFVFKSSFGGGHLQFMLWLSAFDSFLGIKLREMLADDCLCVVPLDSFRPDIPGGDFSLRIKHEDRIILSAFHQQAKSLFAVAKRCLRQLAFSDVSHNCQDGVFAAGLNWAKHDVNRKLTSVFPQPVEFKACSHRTRAGRGNISAPVLGMPAAKSFRDEDLNQAPNQLCFAIAEKPLRRWIHSGDATSAVGYQNRVRRRPEELLEERQCVFRSISLGQIRNRKHLSREALEVLSQGIHQQPAYNSDHERYAADIGKNQF